jgi:hypothetical protein
MITFNRETGDYSVGFGIPKQKPKSKQKPKQLIQDEPDPIFLTPLSAGTVIVFDKETGEYSNRDKGKQRMETESESELEPESELNDDEINQLELEIERDMKRQAVVDLTVDDILDDLAGSDVEEEEDEEDEEEKKKGKGSSCSFTRSVYRKTQRCDG